MDNISFLIFWGFIIFVLPRIFGKNQKKGKRFEYPDETLKIIRGALKYLGDEVTF